MKLSEIPRELFKPGAVLWVRDVRAVYPEVIPQAELDHIRNCEIDNQRLTVTPGFNITEQSKKILRKIIY